MGDGAAAGLWGVPHTGPVSEMSGPLCQLPCWCKEEASLCWGLRARATHVVHPNGSQARHCSEIRVQGCGPSGSCVPTQLLLGSMHSDLPLSQRPHPSYRFDSHCEVA